MVRGGSITPHARGRKALWPTVLANRNRRTAPVGWVFIDEYSFKTGKRETDVLEFPLSIGPPPFHFFLK